MLNDTQYITDHLGIPTEIIGGDIDNYFVMRKNSQCQSLLNMYGSLNQADWFICAATMLENIASYGDSQYWFTEP